MTVELRFFATFRSAVGQKSVERDYGVDTVGDLLAEIEAEWPELSGELLRDGEIPGQVSVLRNGKDVHHLEGPATPVEPGDSISVFPPVAGG